MQHIQVEAAKAVNKVINDGRNLTQVLGEAMRRQASLSAQERGALQDLSYGTIRFYSRLNFILAQLLDRPVHDRQLHCLLLVALYQLQHTKAGQHAIVDHAVRAAKSFNAAASGLVNAVLRNFLRKQANLLEQADQQEFSRYAYPQWWIDMLQAQYQDKASAILESGNLHPPMTLRVNARKTSVHQYRELLETQGIASRIVEPNALILEHPLSVDRLPKFSDGWISVQDAGAQYAAKLLDVRDGMYVLDACAAPGGKTAHLLETADIHLIALDRDEQRLERVRENLQRLNLAAKVLKGDASTPEEWWDGKSFERILADVPCSASGVIRRHPDIKWLRRPQDVESFAVQQERILQSLWSLLARDGKLLYATCSIFARENQQVVSRFLSRNRDARQIELSAPEMKDGQLLPNETHDGFFYALLQKRA